MTQSPPPARREILLVLALTFLGAWFRFVSLGRIGLSHFDEGIYALAGLWAISPGGVADLDPMVIPYAPPGFPILVGLSYGLLGISDTSAVLVSILCGIATIPVAAWLGRRTFGPGAGAAAAAFAALSMPHIAFSRKALTDVPFLLTWLVAVGLGGRFLEKPRFGRALVLGLSVGVAQNFKYNGWLAGVLVAVTALIGLAVRREERARGAFLRTFGWGAFAAFVSALMYWPWYGFVERHGGYAALVRHHRGYLGGISTWWPHLNQQLAQEHVLSGDTVWCLVTWFVAYLSCILVQDGNPLAGLPSPRRFARFGAVLFLGGAVFVVVPNLPWWLGLGWMPWLIRSERSSVRLLGVWWLGLSILTPFYHPYARLWLPLHSTGWLMLAGLIVHIPPFLRTDEEAARFRLGALGPMSIRVALSVVLVGCAFAGVHASRAFPRPFPRSWILDPVPTLRRIVFSDLPREAALKGKRVRVLGRRPLVFYLVLQGRTMFQLEPGWKALAAPPGPDDRLLLDTVLIEQETHPDEVMRRLDLFWETELSYSARLDPITLLDYEPSVAELGPDHRKERTILVLSPKRPPSERSRSNQTGQNP